MSVRDQPSRSSLLLAISAVIHPNCRSEHEPPLSCLGLKLFDQGLRHTEARRCNRCFGQGLGSSDPRDW
jgi:hypothetical protein